MDASDARTLSSRTALTRRAFLRVGVGVGIAGALAACSPAGQEGEQARSWAPAPRDVAGRKQLATAEGQKLLLHTAGGDVEYWAGVNLGSTIPGHSPGELAITREHYRRWFAQMGELGVRVVRPYTIHPPHMYEELRAYNLAHPDAPLYLVMGIYLPDESYLETHDLFSDASTEAMKAEVRDASAAVHGQLTRPPTPGRASGTWTADVSDWVAAWIVGVEWDPEATVASDAKNADRPAHEGRYFVSTADATPTERWIAARMDELAGYEAGSGRCMPIALANWPTADPLRHPEEPLEREDILSVDANNVVPQSDWTAGTFASYHAYPYYPDFQLLQPSYQGDDPYRAYLLDLAGHHTNIPTMISEFGVPSSLGSAHRGSLGRDQGEHSERDAMKMNADMLRLFKDAGLAGGLVFQWSDEWFKFTWNTLPRQAPSHSERRALWHDALTNEQWFGLLAQDPVRVGPRVVHEATAGLRNVTLDHDAGWVYVTLTWDDAPTGHVELGFDIVPGAGLPLPIAGGEAVNDALVTVDLAGESATAYIRGAIDPVLLDGLPPESVPQPETNGWSLQRLTLNRPITTPTQQIPADLLDVGRLVRGSWDPSAGTYDSLATWEMGADTASSGWLLRLRLPWGLLAMADPSSKLALVPEGNRPTGVEIDQIGVSVAAAGGITRFAIRWEAWNKAEATERLKAGVEEFAAALRETSG